MGYVYVTIERFNNGNASSTRILSFCKILKDLGKDVVVISLAEVENEKIHIYKDIKYVSLRSGKNTFVSRICNLLFHKRRLVKSLNYLNEIDKIEGVFLYDIPPQSIFYLKKYARLNGIRLFHDSVEWYSPEQFKWGRFALPYALKSLLNRYFIDKRIFVFAISKYLNFYFQSKGIRSLRIPVMLDMNEISFGKKLVSGKLRLIYAGTPQKKDYLREIIDGIARLENDKLEKIELHMFGVTKEQLIRVCEISESTIEKLGSSLVARGRVGREEVLNQLQSADFTVLLRAPELRYAKAGFPTKVVESLATATPVICNITSDLGEYLIDGENSLIVEECTAKAFEATLRKAIVLKLEERYVLCQNARNTAESKFDYRIFNEQFRRFLFER